MSRIAAMAVLALLPAIAGCHSSDYYEDFLFEEEIDFLAEDVIELMTIVFQVSENAFVGDPVEPEDVVEVAGPGNDFTAVYDLPPALRIGLGPGFGRATVRIEEDGVPNGTPLAFTFAGTTALTVVIEYTIQYEGETLTGRLTDNDFYVRIIATRDNTAQPFVNEYLVDGDCFLGATFCRLITEFAADGSPRTGLIPFFPSPREYGDGSGIIDDPDVFDVLELDLDYGPDDFVAEGDVDLAYFDEIFLYEEVF